MSLNLRSNINNHNGSHIANIQVESSLSSHDEE